MKPETKTKALAVLQHNNWPMDVTRFGPIMWPRVARGWAKRAGVALLRQLVAAELVAVSNANPASMDCLLTRRGEVMVRASEQVNPGQYGDMLASTRWDGSGDEQERRLAGLVAMIEATLAWQIRLGHLDTDTANRLLTAALRLKKHGLGVGAEVVRLKPTFPDAICSGCDELRRLLGESGLCAGCTAKQRGRPFEYDLPMQYPPSPKGVTNV